MYNQDYFYFYKGKFESICLECRREKIKIYHQNHKNEGKFYRDQNKENIKSPPFLLNQDYLDSHKRRLYQKSPEL